MPVSIDDISVSRDSIVVNYSGVVDTSFVIPAQYTAIVSIQNIANTSEVSKDVSGDVNDDGSFSGSATIDTKTLGIDGETDLGISVTMTSIPGSDTESIDVVAEGSGDNENNAGGILSGVSDRKLLLGSAALIAGASVAGGRLK